MKSDTKLIMQSSNQLMLSTRADHQSEKVLDLMSQNLFQPSSLPEDLHHEEHHIMVHQWAHHLSVWSTIMSQETSLQQEDNSLPIDDQMLRAHQREKTHLPATQNNDMIYSVVTYE